MAANVTQSQGNGHRHPTSEHEAESYYDLPVIHRPHWKWSIILYFFVGGIAGAAYIIATVANIFGGREGKRITRAGYYVSFAAMIPSPLLLIYDLGRPDRFHHMLRVVKLRSPMSLGVWTLLGFSLFSTLSALIQASRDNILRSPQSLQRVLVSLPCRLTGALGSVPAAILSGYTGVLLAVTAVPLWTKSHLTMGPLFLASAMSNAAAAITLVLALSRGTKDTTLENLERLDSIALATEVGLLALMRSRLGPTIDRPLSEGHTGKLLRYGFKGLGVALPALVQIRSGWLGKHPPRGVTAATSAFVLVGGFILRYVIVIAGRQSADDPQATFEMTKRTADR